MVELDLLIEGTAKLGLLLTNRQIEQFAEYARLLREWNQRFNLTAVDSQDAIQERHFLDSLTCVLATANLNKQRLVDVGSGAGFPGLPLKICFPEVDLVLLESVGKKARFLEEVVQVLELSAVQIVSMRAENFGQLREQRESFDWAVARAVAPLPILVEYLLPLTRIGGHSLALKGANAEQELMDAEKAVSLLGGGEIDLILADILVMTQKSYLVKIKKVSSTPQKYPRKPGMPAKRPL